MSAHPDGASSFLTRPAAVTQSAGSIIRTFPEAKEPVMAEKGRGFAGMDEAKQRETASTGGKAARQKGNAHEVTPEEARAAGKKGGRAAHQRGTAHEFTPAEAAEAGRKGGKAAHQKGTAHEFNHAEAA